MDPNAANDIPGVPPPPAEVKVRTMRSDIESMKQSGGGLPQFRNVTVEGLAMEREIPAAVASPVAAAEMARVQSPVSASSSSSSNAVQEKAAVEAAEISSGASHKVLGVILVIIVTIIAVLAVTYFAYKELVSSGTGSQVPPAAQSTTG